MIPARQLIPSMLAEVIRKAPLCPEKVEFAWRHAVGPAVQRVTSVRLDGDGVLHVATREPHWGREVKRAQKMILARLEAMLGAGTVRKIVV